MRKKAGNQAAEAARAVREGRALLDTTSVAGLLDVHPKHVFRLLRRGLPGHRLAGGPWRFVQQEVLDWLRQQAPRTASVANSMPPPLLAANGDVCVELLLAALQEASPTPFGLVQADATSGRAHLARGSVIAAGAHGVARPAAAAGAALVRLHFTRRAVGLAYVRGKRLRSLKELAGLRLASRGSSAGVRAHLDGVLEAEGLAPAKLHQRALICASHRDVALALLSGKAEVGLLTVAWAARVGLACLPIADEDYGIELRQSQLSSAPGKALVRALQGKSLPRALSSGGGYQPAGMGELRL